MHKINEEKRQDKNKKSNFIVWLFVSVVVFLSISRVLIANQTVGASEKLHSLDEKIAQTQTKNDIIAEDLRKKESLLTLESKAKQLGFAKTIKYSFLTPSDPVAYNGELNKTP